jgi:hypothetical protein
MSKEEDVLQVSLQAFIKFVSNDDFQDDGDTAYHDMIQVLLLLLTF